MIHIVVVITSQEARREEMLVNRLIRQSQQERRIAVQLLQARHEKEVIRRNRLAREKQYEFRRLKEFEQALDKEKVHDFFQNLVSKRANYSLFRLF